MLNQVQNQEPRTQSRFTMRVSGTEVSKPALLSAIAHQQEMDLRGTATGTQVVHSRM